MFYAKFLSLQCLFSLPQAFPVTANDTNVVLLASTGCLSHDALLFRLGKLLLNQLPHRKYHWLQLRLWSFGGEVDPRLSELLSKKFYPAIHEAEDKESLRVLDDSRRCFWQAPIPLDPDRLWDSMNSLRIFFFGILWQQIFRYEEALASEAWQEKVRLIKGEAKLVVVDHTLNDATMALASLLGRSSVYISNYPLLSHVISEIGVASPPAYVPSVASSFPTHQMSFDQRLRNIMMEFSVARVRDIADIFIAGIYRRAGLPLQRSLSSIRRSVSLVATPAEPLLDIPRPLSRKVQYLGCLQCWEDGREKKLTKGMEEVEVLVSFGSIPRTDTMPRNVAVAFAAALASLNLSVIWQTASGNLEFLDQHLGPNVTLKSWVPFRRILRAPNIRLLVCHGGLSTLTEAMAAGVPVLGIPLQGDQSYNLQRLVERGAAISLPVHKLDVTSLRSSMTEALFERRDLTIRARSLQSQLESWRKLTGGGEFLGPFWLAWTERHSHRLQQRTQQMSISNPLLVLVIVSLLASPRLGQ